MSRVNLTILREISKFIAYNDPNVLWSWYSLCNQLETSEENKKMWMDGLDSEDFRWEQVIFKILQDWIIRKFKTTVITVNDICSILKQINRDNLAVSLSEKFDSSTCVGVNTELFVPKKSASTRLYQRSYNDILIKEICGVGNFIYYYPDKPLGTGSVSTIYEGFHETLNRKAAVKFIKPDAFDVYEEDFEKFRRNVCSNVVQYYAEYPVQTTSNTSSFTIAMELAKYNFQDYVLTKRHSKEVLVKLLKEACKGIESLHCKGAIHRHIDQKNILVMHDDHCKISDFGTCKKVSILNESHSSKPCGMRGWISDKFIQSFNTDFWQYTEEADIFWMGVAMFYILSDEEHPFHYSRNSKYYFVSFQNWNANKRIPRFRFESCFSKMLGLDIVNHFKMEQVVKDSWNWDEGKCRRFIHFAMIYLKSLTRTDNDVMNLNGKLFKVIETGRNWKSYIENPLLSYLVPPKGLKWTYDDSFSDLVRLINNLDRHLKNKNFPKDIFNQFKTSTLLMRDFNDKFPKLVPILYNSLRHHRGRDEDLLKFY